MKTYEIDFNGLVACKIEVKGDEMKVVAAMDGGGYPIDLKDIKVSDKHLGL